MKTPMQFRLIIFLALLLTFNGLIAQNSEKERIRLNVGYVNVIDQEQYLNIKASARINKETVEVAGIELTVSQELEDGEIELGTTSTNARGMGKFVFADFSRLVADEEGVYTVLVSFAGNDQFKRGSKDVSFKKANIEAELVTKDSVNYINARLLDVQLDSAIAEVPLTVQVDRLFRPLKIEKDFFMTDEDGEVEVAIPDGIPGVEGKLQLEVVLNESDDYGTVKRVLEAQIGKPIVDESTYDQRTMWSPRGKTPIFLLAVTYSFGFVVWGIFVYLFFNLIRIYKS